MLDDVCMHVKILSRKFIVLPSIDCQYYEKSIIVQFTMLINVT